MGKIPILPPKNNQTTPNSISSLFNAGGVDGFSELTQHANKRQMEDDLVTVMDVEGSFALWEDEVLNDPDTGFLTRQGRDAKGLFETYQSAAELKYLELNDGLKNGIQQAMFETRFQQKLQRSAEQVAAYEAREVDVHRRTTLGEASITETRRAVELMKDGDVAGAADRLDMAGRFLRQSMSGLPIDQKDEAQHMLLGGYHSEVFTNQLEDGPEGASAYLVEHQSEIEPHLFDHLFQLVTDKSEKAEGEALFESLYSSGVGLPEIIQTIDASDAPDRQKAIARELAEDQNATEQAEQVGLVKQRLQRSEQASNSAVQLIDQGTAFDQVPDELMDSLTPEHRRAVRTVYLQKVSGDAAPRNAKLELELHQSWIKYVNGESDAFLELPLASQYGTHNRARLDLWINRQAQLIRGDSAVLAELSRRKFAYNKATTFIADAVAQRTTDVADQTKMQGQLNEEAVTYINHWHETNPGQMMEPKALVDTLEVMIGPVLPGRLYYPQVDEFIDLNDLPDTAVTDIESGPRESDGGLPDAVIKALQGSRMDERGVWFDKENNALTDKQGFLIDKDGDLLRDGEGNPVASPFRDQNIRRVVAPAIAVPPAALAAGGALIAGLFAAEVISEAERLDLEGELAKGEQAFNRFLGEIAQNNPLVAGILLSPEALNVFRKRTEALDPELKKPLPGFPAETLGIEGNGSEEFPIGAPPPAVPPSDLSDDLGGPQIEVLPDQSDHDFGGPQVLESNEHVEKKSQSEAKGNTPISLKKSDHRPGSLSNDDTRDFYNGRIAKAKEINEKIEDPVEGAQDGHYIRNKERTLSRRLMKDRKEAERLDRTKPNKSYNELMERYSKDGYEGPESHDIIRKRAFQTNPKVNKKYGTQKR